MTQTPCVTSSSFQSRVIKNAAYALAVTGAALLPLTMPTAASAYTIGQTNASTASLAVRGQGFTPNVQGNGTGAVPGSGSVTLNSFTFAYNTAAGRTSPTLYIYSTLPSPAGIGTGALFSSTSASNSLTTDPTFTGGSFVTRTFTFTGATLNVGTQYYALLSSTQDLRNAGSDAYTGGARYTNGAGVLNANTTDAAFIADFTPVPFAFNPLFGLGMVGLSKARRGLRRRNVQGGVAMS